MPNIKIRKRITAAAAQLTPLTDGRRLATRYAKA